MARHFKKEVKRYQGFEIQTRADLKIFFGAIVWPGKVTTISRTTSVPRKLDDFIFETRSEFSRKNMVSKWFTYHFLKVRPIKDNGDPDGDWVDVRTHKLYQDASSPARQSSHTRVTKGK